MELTDKIEGAIVPIITPLINGRFDSLGFGRVANGILSHGNGLFVLGNTGEFPSLDSGTKKQVIDFTAEHYTGSNILIGTSGNTLDETISMTRYAAKKGIKTVVLTPFFGQQNGIDPVTYVSEAIDGNEVDSLIYINPAITRNKRPTPNQVSDLSRIPGVIGIKDSTGDLDYLAEIGALSSDSFGIFTGTQELLEQSFDILPSLRGFVPSSGNTSPKLVADIWAHRRPKDFAELRAKTEVYKLYKSPAETEKVFAYLGSLIASSEMVNGKH